MQIDVYCSKCSYPMKHSTLDVADGLPAIVVEPCVPCLQGEVKKALDVMDAVDDALGVKP